MAHAAPALLYLLNPYTVVFTSRGTISLLTYAALPWLVLVAHRGLAEPRAVALPRGVRADPARLAGGGMNAGVIVWALVARAAAASSLRGGVLGAHLARRVDFVWRAGGLRGLGSAWWALPVLLQGLRRGVPLLHRAAGHDLGDDQPVGVVWLLGFWVMYIGAGFGETPEPSCSRARPTCSTRA